jgi:hypothetical protein
VQCGRFAILLLISLVFPSWRSLAQDQATPQPPLQTPAPDRSPQNPSPQDQNPSNEISPSKTPPNQASADQPSSNVPPENPRVQTPSSQNPSDQNPPSESKPPQNPTSDGEKKGESTNPATGVVEATKKWGVQTLIKVRDWETGWFTGPYVSRSRDMVTLTGQQRRDIYLQQTLTTPSAYFKRMFTAAIDQARHSPSQWPEGWNGYGERFASREGQFIVANSLAAFGNAALRYEPRYDQCRCGGFRLRTRHAILRNFVTYDASELNVRPQWALYGGAFGGGLVSTAWKPHPRNAFAEGGRAMLGQAGYGALLNFFIEFAGDINRKLGAKK